MLNSVIHDLSYNWCQDMSSFAVHVILCYLILCYVMIYCTMIYHIVLCNDILHYDISYCAVTMYCTMIHYIVFCYDTWSTKPYKKYLISLVCSVRRASYGSSFSPSLFSWPARFALEPSIKGRKTLGP